MLSICGWVLLSTNTAGMEMIEPSPFVKIEIHEANAIYENPAEYPAFRRGNSLDFSKKLPNALGNCLTLP
jgi:hypothetical protein